MVAAVLDVVMHVQQKLNRATGAGAGGVHVPRHDAPAVLLVHDDAEAAQGDFDIACLCNKTGKTRY